MYISLNILGVIIYYTIPKGDFVQSKSSVALKEFENMDEIMSNPQLLASKSSEEKYNTKN